MVKRDSEKTDLASCIENISLGETDKGRASVIMTLKDYNGTKVRIGEFLDTVFSEDKHVVTVVRTALYGWENGWREPI
jgi:hypothetical protein